MKILLVNPFGTPFEVLSPPLSLAYIASYTRQVYDDCEIKIFDFEKDKLDIDTQIGIILKESPNIIGLTSLTPNFNGAIKLVRAIKENLSQVKIIIGGVHVTATRPERMENVDTVVYGEGEKAFVELLGLIKKGETLPFNYSSSLMKDIDIIPAWDLIDLKSYKFFAPFKKKRQAVMYWSRGCPYNCVFCSNAVWRFKIPRVRYRSPHNIVEEILLLKNNYNIGEVYVFDDEINTNTKWLVSVLDEIIKNKLDIYWKCQARASRYLVSEELLNKMREAGCWQIAWGIESGSNRVLSGIRKKIKKDDIIYALRLSRKAGIVNQGLFMIGNIWLEDGRVEGEGFSDAMETIEFAKNLREEGLLDYIQFNIATPFPGSEMWEIVNRFGLLKMDITNSLYFDTHSLVFEHPRMSPAEVAFLHRKAWKEFVFNLSLVMRHILKLRGIDDLKNLIRSAGVALKVLTTGHARSLKRY